MKAVHCTFAASGMLHVIPLAAGLISKKLPLMVTLYASFSCFFFFILHGHLIWMQRIMNVRQWPPVLAYLSTWSMLLITAPLATEPFFFLIHSNIKLSLNLALFWLRTIFDKKSRSHANFDKKSYLSMDFYYH